ncbi:MAG: hypothetical protein IKR17_05995 [Bacteroidales bacterium]|nr:hypothetical protein [Bacteroidales bacterium]
MLDVLYHTSQGEGKISEVVKSAPFRSENDGWLSQGYYFWEGFIEHAHYWGKTHYHGSYYIFKAKAVNNICVFSLLEPIHLKIFNKTCDLIGKNRNDITVRDVINFLRDKTKFSFDAIKAYTSFGSIREKWIPYVESNTRQLPTMPAVQICIFDKRSIARIEFVYSSLENDCSEDFIMV